MLLCTKDVDEFCFQSMMTYGAPAADGEDAPEPFELKNVASGDLDLASEEEKKEAEETTKDNEALFAAMKDALGDSVMKVAVSSRLTDAPACITAAGMGVVVWLVYHGILYVLRVNAVATLLSIVIGAAVYAVLLLLLKGLNEQEILRFPKGRMLADVAKKWARP